MEDAPPGPSPLSIRQSYGFPLGEEEEDEEEEGEDLLTPLLQSRRPSRQYVSMSPPPGGDSSLPAFTNPWPCSGILQHRSSAPRVPLIQVRDESPGGRAREARPSVVSEDAVAGLPLTRFPPWTSNSDRERSKSEEGAGCRCDEGSLRRGVVHAAVLAAQFVAFTGVFCVWVGVAVGEGADHSGFWHKLWVYFQPVLGGLGLLAAAAMLAYEADGLSDGVFLGVQAGVLAVAGAAGLCVVWWALETGSRAVVGAAAGTAAMMLGVGVFGFARAAVVWWLGG
ncbi:peroxisomal membrane protein PEX31 [Metarhizium guizhouense ARSEF 977]|uniref:Peroxisomal membrane protein PEX31 n=1 Tax=Metarhizium guizhouense (strain ARSEF 977) TaxID=1276136 RepID=A0A0B4HBE4_METGA|nr:peroxisomal membrane protein PEX31 [Metarhizium guizhouense ARSEF 977]